MSKSAKVVIASYSFALVFWLVLILFLTLNFHLIFFLIYEKIMPIRSFPTVDLSGNLFRLFFQKKEQQKTLVQSQIQTVPDFVVQDLAGTLVNLKEIVADKPSLLSLFQLYLQRSCQLELNSNRKADSRILIRIA